MGSGVVLTSMDVINELISAMATLGINDLPTDYLYSMRAGIIGYAQKWDVYNTDSIQGSVTGNILAGGIISGPTINGLTPILPESMFRVEVSVTFSGTAPKLHKVTTYGGNITDDEVLSGVALTAGVPVSFDTLVSRGEVVNFYTDQACHITKFKVREILANS